MVFISYSQCLKIESILVDACNGSTSANPEDFNEMIRFRTGSTPLPISQIQIAGAGSSGVFQLNKWPNTTKSWHGLVMNANTASLVAALNSSIQACGYIKEPPGGIIPPNSEVILVTSQYMNPLLNSFANLNDTIYMVFQDTVNNKGQGHFANWSSTPSYRYLCLIDNSTGCKDTVRYNVALLPLHTDGDAIEYGPVVPNYKLRDTNYVNRGCQAPFIPLNINIVPTVTSITLCKNSTTTFSATTTSIGYSSVQWSCSNGSFSSPNSFTTNFAPSSGFIGNTYVYCTIYKPCGSGFNFVKDSILVKVIETPSVNIVVSPSATLCSSVTATLSAVITNTASTGSYNIQWQPGNISAINYTTNTSGIYTLHVSNTCGSSTETVAIFVQPSATLSLSASSSTFCSGNSVTLTANSNATNYVWSNGVVNTSSIVVNSGGIYTVSVSNSCNTATAIVSIISVDAPTLTISQTPSVVCNGQSYTLTANFNNGILTWNNGATGVNIVGNTSGVYSATVSNACGTITQSIGVNVLNIPPLQLYVSQDTLCALDSSILVASGGSGNYLWNTGSTTNSITIYNGGWYVVQSNTACGLMKDSVYIYDGNFNIHPTISDTAVLVGMEVGFICSDCSNNTSWNFGDNSSSTYTLAVHNYQNAGYYTITISSQNNLGCIAVDTLYIRVYDNIVFEVPNIFTPNGDKVNDEYFVRTKFVKELYGIIYDRWGKVMFEFFDVNDKWNGENKEGKAVPDGSYFYIFQAKDLINKTHEKKGALQIIH